LTGCSKQKRGEERLVIFGDYDVDGVTATTILQEVLRHFGWRVETYLPNRMEEGYGLSRDGVENCLKAFNNKAQALPESAESIKLLLAVDCGSTSVETIDWLNQSGVEVVVLDHHQVADPPPRAIALVNPQLAINGSSKAVDFTGFCSAGLAFKMAHAVLKRARDQGLPGAAEYDLRPLLDLVALGTIADLVPLTGENRVLVAAGLERLNTTRRPGLIALKQVSQSPQKLGTYDVGFQLAPRLNAAGRLESADESLRLLLASDLPTAIAVGPEFGFTQPRAPED
jgi:single-stranded-DNA-specific exonuclease